MSHTESRFTCVRLDFGEQLSTGRDSRESARERETAVAMM
jgi:hypothetical protein